MLTKRASVRRFVVASLLCAAVAVCAPARADSVLEVNQSLLDAIRLRASSPPVASRAIAMVGIAMYDAVNAATGLYDTPYAYTGPAVGGASADAAAYAAGYTILGTLFPTLDFSARLTTGLSGLGGGIEVSLGRTLGIGVANAFAAARADDGSAAAQSTYVYGTGPGAYRSTSAATQPLLPGYGTVRPFAVADIAAITPAGPPAIGSPAWIAAYAEVRDRGCATCGTAEEQQVAGFWADVGGTQTPPGHWLAIADSVMDARDMSTLDAARVSAMLGAALGDAAIASWQAKYLYDDWRPITAIHDCTLATCGVDGDPAWQALWAAPNFPGYISGHSTFSSAAATVLVGVFGDDTAFCSTSDTSPGFPSPVTRCYSSFSAASAEAGDSRILGGIHFEFDNTDGLLTGAAVGRAVLSESMFAVPEPSSPTLLVTALAVPLLLGGRRRARGARFIPS